MTVACDTLDLVRDYEGQIAMLKFRVQWLEQREKELERCLAVYHSSPETMLEKMQIAGFPAIDIADIYDLLDEWHRLGGDQALLDAWRAK